MISARDCVDALLKICSSLGVVDCLNELARTAVELQEQLLLTKSFEIIKDLFEDILKIWTDASKEQFFDVLKNVGEKLHLFAL